MRLIDADELKRSISQNNKIPRIFQQVINSQPTAYDIDEVVEELETIKEEALVEYNMAKYNLDNNIGNGIAENYRKDMNEGRCFAYDEAIEIVKQGGVSDDVCEWKEDAYGRWHTDCNTLADNNPLEYTYCPYCDKKIKVVDNDK